jgi:Domain of unknown function (DUF6249)
MESGPFAVAIAFWVFVAIATVAGIVGEYKKRQLTLEPLRAAIEKGQQLDPAVVERLMAPPPEAGIKPLTLMVWGVLVSAAGIGVILFAVLLARMAPQALWPIIGAGVIVLCLGVGLLVAGRIVDSHQRRRLPQA